MNQNEFDAIIKLAIKCQVKYIQFIYFSQTFIVNTTNIVIYQTNYNKYSKITYADHKCTIRIAFSDDEWHIFNDSSLFNIETIYRIFKLMNFS